VNPNTVACAIGGCMAAAAVSASPSANHRMLNSFPLGFLP
jgi:hypothetical protein